MDLAGMKCIFHKSNHSAITIYSLCKLLGNFEMIGSLLSQFAWLLSNVECGNVYLLFRDFKKYKGHEELPQEVSMPQKA